MSSLHCRWMNKIHLGKGAQRRTATFRRKAEVLLGELSGGLESSTTQNLRPWSHWSAPVLSSMVALSLMWPPHPANMATVIRSRLFPIFYLIKLTQPQVATACCTGQCHSWGCDIERLPSRSSSGLVVMVDRPSLEHVRTETPQRPGLPLHKLIHVITQVGKEASLSPRLLHLLDLIPSHPSTNSSL